jgi:hypothetical protein
MTPLKRLVIALLVALVAVPNTALAQGQSATPGVHQRPQSTTSANAGRYRRASAREQRVLRAMAAGGGEASTIEDLRQRLQMGNSELQPWLRFLVEKGLPR